MLGSRRVYNVVLFGATGCGKSSIVNLLIGKPVANVSVGIEACTKRAQRYPISFGEMDFRLWDTMGFNQAGARGIDLLSPYEQAHALLRNLPDGVDLILLCVRKDGINTSLRNLYWLLDSFFFNGRARVALVLTHFDTIDHQWWERNRNYIAQRCALPVESLPYACITTVHSRSPQSEQMYNHSKHVLSKLLQGHTTTSIPITLHLNLSSTGASTAAIESLTAQCQLGPADATKLVERLKVLQRPFHVVLFGEAGAGKSSIVNLICGKQVAAISRNLQSCTLDASSYEINTGLYHFVVWDTVGFDGVHLEYDVCKIAIRNATHLIRDLQRQGGIDLLVFCKASGWPTVLELNTFRLFQEFLCDGQIPVAFIITHLESRDPMERWWENNGDHLLKAFGLKPSEVVGHACVTALGPDHPDYQKSLAKLSFSRESVLNMLEDAVSIGSTLNHAGWSWFSEKLLETVKVQNRPKKAKTVAKNLMDRCGLTKEQAEDLSRFLCAQVELDG